MKPTEEIDSAANDAFVLKQEEQLPNLLAEVNHMIQAMDEVEITTA